MGLVLNKSIKKMQKGYTTAINVNNIEGGTLAGTKTATFGQLVAKTTTVGSYKAVDADQTISAATDIAGIVVATNIKSPTTWPAESPNPVYQVNEVFDLLLTGRIAIALTSTETIANVVPGAQVYVTAAGVFTSASTGNYAYPNAKFTGLNEKQADNSYLAEISIGL